MPDSEVNYQRVRTSYLTVFLILAGFTALEVGASFLSGPIRIPALVVLAAGKATLVLLYFMHLKFDSRIFAMFFLIGLILLIPLVLIMTLVMPVLK